MPICIKLTLNSQCFSPRLSFHASHNFELGTKQTLSSSSFLLQKKQTKTNDETYQQCAGFRCALRLLCRCAGKFAALGAKEAGVGHFLLNVLKRKEYLCDLSIIVIIIKLTYYLFFIAVGTSRPSKSSD